MMTVLVTGGMGYIGSHTCLRLLEAGYGVVSVDNLCNSSPLCLERVQAITGKTLRSSTMFIKQNGRLIGLLCISFDDSRYQDAIETIMRLCHPDRFVEDNCSPARPDMSAEAVRTAPATTERYHNSIDAVAGDAVARELARLGVTADRLTPDERVQIIASLEASGIFLLKGAVKDVASALRCSQASVYRYLSQIKKDAD